jgi:hypothetical protein
LEEQREPSRGIRPCAEDTRPVFSRLFGSGWRGVFSFARRAPVGASLPPIAERFGHGERHRRSALWARRPIVLRHVRLDRLLHDGPRSQAGALQRLSVTDAWRRALPAMVRM